MIEKAPISFRPNLKSVIWGGSRLCSYKGIPDSGEKIGESWEVSAVPGRESVVAEGAYAGMTLPRLAETFGEELLGRNVIERHGCAFPLLVKLIDAADNLSVQVHPDDTLAMRRHGTPGKTEMWYIIDSEAGARIYSGFKRPITPSEYERRVADNTFPEVLADHAAHPGEVYFLPAGRVHSIGAGVLLAEIQQSSDITYRIYDYDRRDAAGKPRELHTALAEEAIDFSDASPKSNPTTPGKSDMEEIASCGHFAVKRLVIDEPTPLYFDSGSFTVIMCLGGSATLTYAGGRTDLPRGHSLLLPATLNAVVMNGNATILTARYPSPASRPAVKKHQ